MTLTAKTYSSDVLETSKQLKKSVSPISQYIHIISYNMQYIYKLHALNTNNRVRYRRVFL